MIFRVTVQEWGRGILEIVLPRGRLGKGRVFLEGLRVEGNYVYIYIYKLVFYLLTKHILLCNITLL